VLKSAASILVFLLLCSVSFADVGPGLYVSEDGEDSGPCTDMNRPCASILYALEVAGKNTRIHVREGTYRFDDPEAILYAMSGAVHVHGGYVMNDEGQWIKGGVAFLTSVPPGYRDFFSVHGFIVLRDSKGDDAAPATAQAMLEEYERAQRSSSAATCTGGRAAGFECSGIDLLAHVARQDFSSAPGAVADIWGFVDLNTRREYVIVGVKNGTAVFDVTDPESPREAGFIGGKSATWRDVKILQLRDPARDRWRAYAYVTTDGTTDELLVMDLADLPHGVSRVAYGGDFPNAHNVYLTDTDYATGVAANAAEPLLVVAGAGIDNGQFRIYSLANPASPQFLERVSSAGYMHDASSLRVADTRSGECLNAAADCHVLLDFNEENVELWDISDPADPALLATVPPYANTGYVHSGWWTEDRRYVLVHDELDERNNGLRTTVRVLSIDSLRTPTLAATWTGSQPSVDHNGFVRGNRYYVSTYTRGLTILDITDPSTPTEAGYFDTYPIGNGAVFAGAWGAYPFLPSGIVAVSDINSGLFLLRDATGSGGAGSLGFERRSHALGEGTSLAVPVSRLDGSSGAVSADYEVVGLGADSSDFTISAGRLEWADGESGSRTIVLDAIADGVAEGLEEVMLRLVDPRGGATLANGGISSVFVADPGAQPVFELVDAAIDVAELGPGRAVITVARRGSAAGAASVGFSTMPDGATAGVDFSGPASGTLSWEDGDALPKSVEFDILTDSTDEAAESFRIEFAAPQGAAWSGTTAAQVTIRDGASGNGAPLAAVGADQTRTAGSNVMLDGSASFDPDGDALSYLWNQESGPPVTLNGAMMESAAFIAPDVSATTTLRFRLTVTDDRGLSDSATTTVTVTAQRPSAGDRSGGSGAMAPGLLLALTLLAGARLAASSFRRRHSRTQRRGSSFSRRDCA